jgi:PAS domain-containing protein
MAREAVLPQPMRPEPRRPEPTPPEFSRPEFGQPEPLALGEALERWALAVHGAPEPCLIIDDLSVIVAASPRACELLGLGDPVTAPGQSLFAGVLRLLDFTAAGAPLGDGELEKIPPVLAFSSARLARALMRVQSGPSVVTLDAVATPLFDGEKPVGSLTFFLEI